MERRIYRMGWFDGGGGVVECSHVRNNCIRKIHAHSKANAFFMFHMAFPIDRQKEIRYRDGSGATTIVEWPIQN